ncbi:MAG TPA: LiaF domain-containing protein [Actinomycetota bacterium]|nr:LiaF domain-containing protein [Actinomycetota bacterium]
MKPIRLWIGLVLLTLGVFGILDATGTLNSAETVDRWWPVAIIGLGLIGMLVERRISLGPTIVVGVGFLLLANQQEWTDQDLFGPVLLVVIGLVILSGLWHRRVEAGDRENRVVMFGGTKIKERSEHFSHADVSAIFGGATLDLREAHIDREASVDALALFGGVDVVVPEGWRVALGGTPIFGGCEDKTEGNAELDDGAPLLRVHATAVFGGVGVKNQAA